MSANFVLIISLFGATLVVFGQEQADLEEARQALARGDYRAARGPAGRALTRNSTAAEAEIILGLADTADGQISSAEKHFAKAVALKPSDYRAHTYLGSTYLRQQRLSEARIAFLRVLQLSPTNAVAQYNLGVIYAMQGNPAGALPYFSAVHQSNPADVAALVALLECQLNLKQSRAARVNAQMVQKLLPSDSPILLQVGALLASYEQYDAALPLLRSFAGANPTSSEAAYNLGLALLRTGALKEAEASINRVLRDVRSAELNNLLGAVQEKRGAQNEALQSFAEAARLAPENENFRVDYATSLVDLDLLGQAVAEFSQGVVRLPQSMRLRLGLGSALYLSGKYEEAAQTIVECVRTSPGLAPAYDLLGRVFESAPQHQEEIFAAFQAYLRKGAADAAAHCHFGAMLYARAEGEGAGRLVEAKKHLRRALALNPQLPEAHVQLGVISQAEGRLTEAITAYQRAVALAPTYAIARYRLGLAYQKLGQATKAQVELEAFQNLKNQDRRREKEFVMKRVGELSTR